MTSKAAASEDARRTLRYVELLSDVRTPLADFFSILLEEFQKVSARTALEGVRREATERGATWSPVLCSPQVLNPMRRDFDGGGGSMSWRMASKRE